MGQAAPEQRRRCLVVGGGESEDLAVAAEVGVAAAVDVVDDERSACRSPSGRDPARGARLARPGRRRRRARGRRASRPGPGRAAPAVPPDRARRAPRPAGYSVEAARGVRPHRPRVVAGQDDRPGRTPRRRSATHRAAGARCRSTATSGSTTSSDSPQRLSRLSASAQPTTRSSVGRDPRTRRVVGQEVLVADAQPRPHRVGDRPRLDPRAAVQRLERRDLHPAGALDVRPRHRPYRHRHSVNPKSTGSTQDLGL